MYLKELSLKFCIKLCMKMIVTLSNVKRQDDLKAELKVSITEDCYMD